MSLLTRIAAAGQADSTLYVEDVMACHTYTGTAATLAITTGVDLSTKGGLFWGKRRDATGNNNLYDTLQGRGVGSLYTDSTVGNGVYTSSAGRDLASFDTAGFTLGTNQQEAMNTSAATYVGWSFAVSPKFFTQAQVTVSGSNQTVDLSSLGTVGMVLVKRTDSTSDWYTWHVGLTATNLVYLNTGAVEAVNDAISISGTTLTLKQATIGNGTYIVYAFAHDTASTGIIQCGVFAAASPATITLGWEPQWLLLIKKDSAASERAIFDTARGMSVAGGGNRLRPDSSAAEGAAYSSDYPTATGFVTDNFGAGNICYVAIRRGPMKLPTVGTQVYNAIARTGTGAAAIVTGVGFPPDLVFGKKRTGTTEWAWTDRLRGATYELSSDATTVETAFANDITAFGMDGVTEGSGASGNLNANTVTEILECFRRYPGVFDEVCYTGNGTNNQTYSHNLTVIPELIIIKRRDSAEAWLVYASSLGYPFRLLLNSTAVPLDESPTNIWNSSSTTFTPSRDTASYGGNTNAATYTAYLFATLAGISKVGSYTGNGSALTLDMGFAAGARFFMCKRTDSTGDWFVWDSVRGIVSGNDGHLSLNTTAAEVTTDDSVDPDNSGIIVNEIAATHINVNAATYIYLAFA